MIDYQNDLTKQTNLITFIKTTQQLMETEGLKNVSIRKIAALSGFHNSTIYLYFRNLDELVMLASIKQFQKYSEDLERQSASHSDAYSIFYAIWECFCESAFQFPDVFYNFFFGSCSEDIYEYLNTYYTLFPEERHTYSSDIESMYFGRNYTERCMRILKTIKDLDNTNVSDDSIEYINRLSVSYCKDLLQYKCQHPEADNAILQKRFMDALHYLVDKAEA